MLNGFFPEILFFFVMKKKNLSISSTYGFSDEKLKFQIKMCLIFKFNINRRKNNQNA